MLAGVVRTSLLGGTRPPGDEARRVERLLKREIRGPARRDATGEVDRPAVVVGRDIREARSGALIAGRAEGASRRGRRNLAEPVAVEAKEVGVRREVEVA